MFAERYRINRALGGLFSLVGAGLLYLMLTHTSCMATKYIYPQHKATPYGIVLEILLVLNGHQESMPTRDDLSCEPVGDDEGCAVWIEALRARTDIESLKTCLHDKKEIRIKTEYNKSKHVHITHMHCGDGTTWATHLTDKPNPSTNEPASWRVTAFKPVKAR